jgi:predicted 2-oxoglutarate/Fe(II)-dependent dioxygenase YbiX
MKKNVHVKNFVMTIDNMLSSEICDFIVENMKNPEKNYKQQTTIDNRKGRQDTQRAGTLYLTHLTGLQIYQNINFGGNLGNIFTNCLVEGLQVYSNTMAEALKEISDNNIVDFTEFKFQETSQSGGFHDWHYESASQQTKQRFLVWSIFLNDVEEGGELEFLYHSMRVKPKKGSMVLFPSSFTHTHRGNPPISNTKYIATGWYYAFSE